MNKPTDQDILNYLHRGMVNQLDEKTLREICQSLKFDYDVLPGRGKQSRVWLLLEYVKDCGKLDQLCSLLKEKRPDVNWDAILRGEPVHTSTPAANPSSVDQGGNLLKNQIIIAALITACVGCFATLTVAFVNGYFNLRATDRPIQATQTAEARLTMESTKISGTHQTDSLGLPSGRVTPTASQSPTTVPSTSTSAALIQSSPTSGSLSILPAVTVIGTPDTPTPTPIPAPESETNSIYKSTAGVFFEDELIIALYQFSWQDKRTSFGVSAPAFPEKIALDLTVGDRFIYDQNGKYEIVVSSFSGWGDAVEFTVTRLEEPPQGAPTTETVTVCQNDTGMVFNKSLTIAIQKISKDQISFDAFAPGKSTLSIENQPVGKKFTYQDNGNYEIQIMNVNSFGECVTLDVRRLP